MTRRDVWLIVLAAAWVPWAVGAEATSIEAGVVENHVLDAAVGAAYLVAGIVAMRRQPGNRLGPLMVVVAFLWFAGNYGNAAWPVAAPLGFAASNLSLPFVAWLFLAYPTGRLQTTAERVYIAAFLAWQVIFTVVVWLAFAREQVVHRMLDLDRWLGLASIVAGAVLLVRKRQRASAVERRGLTPLWVGGAFLLSSFAIDTFVTADPSRSDAAYTLFQIESLARMAVPLCFLWGILRSNLDRGRVGGLIERLSGPIPTGGLRDALADVLHDPDLRLAFPLGDGWVDEAGASVADPGDGAGVSRIAHEGRSLAVILHDPAIDDGLVAAAGAATAMALENARLHAEVRSQLEEVRASRARIVDAADAERRRIERDLHDGAQQRLLALSFTLRGAIRRSAEVDPSLAAALGEADHELRGALEELRDLARGIHPAILTDEGLGPALGSLAERAPMPVRVTVLPDRRLSPPIEAAAYFVVAEALTNAARHAGTAVDVTASLANDRLTIRVRDEGPGGADERGGGLRGLADRVAAVEGRLTIESTPGTGTIVMAEFPCG